MSSRDIEERIRMYEALKARRKTERDNRSKLRHLGHDLWKSLNTFTIIGITVVLLPMCFSIGFFTGSTQYDFSINSGIINTAELDQKHQAYQIDDYKIFLVEEDHRFWKGENSNRVGFTQGYNTDKIYIKAGRTPENIYETCVHEKMHNLGIEGGETHGHDQIYEYDSQLKDKTCLKLLHRMTPNEVTQ